MIDLDRMAMGIHSEAVAKGFWGVENAEEVAIGGMHCELSEAWQAGREDKPIEYRISEGVLSEHRPEGVAVELADFVLRMLDWCAANGVELGTIKNNVMQGYVDCPLPVLIMRLHELVANLRTVYDRNGLRNVTAARIVRAIRKIQAWLLTRNVDLWQVVEAKRRYNKTRPYLHGRKY